MSTVIGVVHDGKVWMGVDSYATTRQNGLSLIHLPVPSTSGNYTLSYEIESTSNLAASTGSIEIQITIVDVLTSQGIGINGFAIGILTSFVVVAIPLIRQKLLIV